MDKLTPEQQAELKKLSSERIRAKLVKAGYDEEAVFSFDRQMLLETLAEYTLRPVEAKVYEVELRGRELEMRERELKLREAEVQVQQQRHEAELLAQKQQRDDEIKLRMAELEAQKQQREDEIKLRMAELEAQKLQRDAEMELKKAEINANEQRFAEEQAFRVRHDNRRKAKDEQEQSLTARVKKYSDCLKNVLPCMAADQGEMISFWDTCDNMWKTYEVPKEIQAKLILPLLTPRAKTLVSRLSAEELADIDKIRDFLTAEFKLTPREYRARFNAATRNADETHIAFRARLDNMWNFYMRSRECDNFEKLKDLIVADRLKDSLSPQCLKYCLGIEGHKLLSSKDLADLADVYDANYTADGRYRGGNTQDYKPNKPGSFHGAQFLKRVVSVPGGDRSSAHNDVEAQGHSGQKTKISAGQISRSLCWICKSPNHRQRDCPQKPQDKSTVSQQQDGRSYQFERKPNQVKACTTRPSRNSDVTVRSGGETREVH